MLVIVIVLQEQGRVLVAVAHFYIWPLSKNLRSRLKSLECNFDCLQMSSLWTRNWPFVRQKL